jgi:type IV pilus assembly protein PilY1
LAYSPFDLNGDGAFSSADNVTVSVNGNQTLIAPSGLKSTVGLTSTPMVLDMGSKEIKYTPGSTGQVSTVTENPGLKMNGRQAWRQLK